MQNLLNLAEQHGKEGTVTDAYREYMRELDSPDARHDFSLDLLHPS